MTKLDDIQKAINDKKPISFEYNKEGKIRGIRIGNPHALYIFTPIDNDSDSMRLDIVQTSGVTDTPEKPFPRWMGPIRFDDIDNVTILNDEPSFEPFEGYNPNSSPRYDRPIAKVR
jgi:hypothetical protein